MRAGYVEDTPKKTTRFVNGLRGEILDEISILSRRTIDEAYQCALKEKQKINRKQNARIGGGFGRGKGRAFGRDRAANISDEGSSSKTPGIAKRDNNTRGGRPYQRGRGNGRGRGAAI